MLLINTLQDLTWHLIGSTAMIMKCNNLFTLSLLSLLHLTIFISMLQYEQHVHVELY